VLAHTWEYRHPSPQKIAERAAASTAAGEDKVTLDMTSRSLGLVVVPGNHIVKIEVEEFLSQLRGQSAYPTKTVSRSRSGSSTTMQRGDTPSGPSGNATQETLVI